MKRLVLTALLALSLVSLFSGCAVLRPAGRFLTVYAKRAQFNGSPPPTVYDRTKVLVGFQNLSGTPLAIERLGGHWFEVARYDTTTFDALFLDIPPGAIGWALFDRAPADQPIQIRIHYSCRFRRDLWIDWYIPIIPGARPANAELDQLEIIADRDLRCR